MVFAPKDFFTFASKFNNSPQRTQRKIVTVWFFEKSQVGNMIIMPQASYFLHCKSKSASLLYPG